MKIKRFLLTTLLTLAFWLLPWNVAVVLAQTYTNVYDFAAHSSDAAAVGAGGTIAGLLDSYGGQASTSGGLLNMVASDHNRSYWYYPVYAANSNTQLNQRVRLGIPANQAAGFSNSVFARLNFVGGRTAMYQAMMLDAGNKSPVVNITIIDSNTGDTPLVYNATLTGYNNAHAYLEEFKVEGVQPSHLTLTITDTTSNTVAYSTTLTDSTNTTAAPMQQPGYAGIISTDFGSAGGGSPWSASSLTIDLAPAPPALTAGVPALVSRAAGQNVVSVTPSGGTPPYSVQFYRTLDDWGYTPGVGNAIGSAVSVASSGGVASYTDTASVLPGRYYLYKAIVTDSAGVTTQAGDYLFVEGLRAAPGALPSLSPSAQGGIILATYGDSITAPGAISSSLRTYLAAQGVTIARTANAGFQGSRWGDWRTDATGSVTEGATDTNAGSGNALYATEFGGTIPGSNCLAKAFAITDREITAAGSGKLLVISLFLGMNDLLQGPPVSQSYADAQSVLAAIRVKYPNALIVLQHISYGFPGGNGPTSLGAITNAQTLWGQVKGLADGTHVFAGDESAFYYLYANAVSGVLYGGADQAGWVTNGSEHVHVNEAGSATIAANTSGQFGQGPALMRTALSYMLPATVSGVSISPSAPTVAGGATQQFTATVSGTNSPGQTVTWSASIGSISGSGLYAAPATTGSAQTATITATSTADTSKSGSATITIPAGSPTVSSVVVSPSTVTVVGAATQQFTASVAGTFSPAQTVTWSASAGSITSGGLFTAPAATSSAQAITVTATSTVNTSKAGTATITVPAANQGNNSGGTSPLSPADINAIAAAVVAQMNASGAVVTRTQIVDGPIALLPSPSSADRTLTAFIGDKRTWAFDIVDDDGSPSGRELAIPAGSVVTVTTSRLGTIVSSAITATVPNAGRGRVTYTARTADTAVAGKLSLTVTITSADGGTVDTYGPAVVMVKNK